MGFCIINLNNYVNYNTMVFLPPKIQKYQFVCRRRWRKSESVCLSRFQNLMEALQIRIRTQHQQSMNSFSSKLRPNPRSFFYAHLRAFCASPQPSPSSIIHSFSAPTSPICPLRRDVSVRVGLSDAQLKENWIASLSCPFPLAEATATATATCFGNGESDRVNNAGSDWVLGVDPDTSGALAILKSDDFASSAQVIVIKFEFLVDFSSIAPD